MHTIANESGDVLNIKKIKSRVTLKDMLKQNCIGNLTGIYNAKLLGKFYQQHIGRRLCYVVKYNEKTDSIGIEEPVAITVATNSLSSNKFKAATWHFKILKSSNKVNFECLVLFLMLCCKCS